ncbi:MAG: hypothetical protein ACRD2R_03140 [Terriglobales bacterium]
MAVRPNQSETMEAPAVTPAAEPCDNWAWAAGLESLLASQEVALQREFWLFKAHGGLLCLSPVPDPAGLAAYIPGEYVLDDGRKVRLEAQFTPGAPSNTDELIMSLRRGHSFLLVWRGHPYLVYGAVFDEYIARTGARLFEIRELKLINLLPAKEEDRKVAFVKGRDDPGEIQGVLTVNATFVQPPNWLHPGTE